MANVEFTPRQKALIRKRTKVHELDPSEAQGELNIVPFLDIVVNIIMFLLATTAAVLATAELEARLPTTSRGGRASGNTAPSLNLSVTIAESGIIVAGSGGKLAPGCTQMQQGRVITVERLASATEDRNADQLPDVYDWAALTQCMATIKNTYPDEEQVILSADPQVEYRHLIYAMDAVRTDPARHVPLFPNIMLSAGVR